MVCKIRGGDIYHFEPVRRSKELNQLESMKYGKQNVNKPRSFIGMSLHEKMEHFNRSLFENRGCKQCRQRQESGIGWNFLLHWWKHGELMDLRGDGIPEWVHQLMLWKAKIRLLGFAHGGKLTAQTNMSTNEGIQQSGVDEKWINTEINLTTDRIRK